ncbi:ankyrin repeat-containing domain protein [Mucor mucedo]|uniref:ankyrin repeat-containing domain protein n=1 Tax=Mucor mucedo TaxID=29922 RepID=UPI00222015A5|nr:ankyrin repeat-containing domain protein [Mucor mucedo]KAI7888673.1 ankyrin repeat-containing domain protein [Mucor mucedo]
MQAIDINTKKTDGKPNNVLLPSPPSSPIESLNSRKRAFSISFIQNESTPPQPSKKSKFDIGCLNNYLKKGSPNTCDEQFKRSLLSWACIGKSKEAVQDLLKLVHLDINMKSGPHQTTALHEACLHGFHQGLELLVKHADIDLNATDNQGQTAIHCATQANKIDCLKILLSAGARIDLFSTGGRLPIHIAIQHGFHHGVSLLLSKSKIHDNNPTETDMLWKSNLVDGRSSIQSAIVSGYINTLQLLLDNDSITAKHQTTKGLVQLAVDWNRIECLQLLIKRGCIIDESSLLTAVQQRKIDMVRELSTAGANPCLANGQNPSFLYAANHGFIDMVPLVITPSTSKDCIHQALLLASCLGLRDKLATAVIHTLKSITK